MSRERYELAEETPDVWVRCDYQYGGDRRLLLHVCDRAHDVPRACHTRVSLLRVAVFLSSGISVAAKLVMKRSVARLMAPLGVSLALAIPSVLASQSTQEPEIETVGTGERRATPDKATVMLYIESKAATASAAAAANGRLVLAVRDTLRRLGLDSAATTATYNVGPNYEQDPTVRGEPRRTGYAARTSLRVELKALDQVGRVIDAGLARGATGVEGVYFESSRAEEARRAALAEAAQAARRDAEALAAAVGGTIGPLISMTTASNIDPRRLNVMMRGAVGMVTGTSVSPSEIVVSAGVVTRWRFVPR